MNLDNLTIEDRNHILSNMTNTQMITQLFGFDINDSVMGNDLMFPIPEYMETEKYGILFTSKGGSSYIMRTLKEYNLSEHVDENEFANGFGPVFLSTLHPSSTGKGTPKKFAEFFSILNGKSKKDLIIVTRNPVYKWISGVYQEISMDYSKSNILYGMLQNDYKLNECETNINKLTDDILEKLVYRYLVGSLYRNGTVATDHAALYNQSFFLFILNNKIDMNKLKIVDIDDPNCNINKLLKSYNSEVIVNKTDGLWTHRPKHEHVLKGVIDNLGSSINIKDILKREVGTDFYYYSLLKTQFDKNFVKNNLL